MPASTSSPSSRLRRLTERYGPFLLLAVVTYLPLVFTQPGKVGADTKTYLYLDPGRLMRDAAFLWDSGVGLGGVTHQVIGYLWPMGPFYWTFDVLGVPDWLAQRLWLASLMFAAGTGVLYLLRTLGWPERGTPEDAPASTRWWDAGMVVAALAYALSPYVLDYAARISVILLPWAGLPWLIALLARAIRGGGWRYPAAFALVTLTVSSTNLTSVVLVGIGPLLWVVFAVWVEKEATFRQALGAVWRVGVLTVGVSLWWFVGLVVEGQYGIPIVRYTETYQAVAVASTTPEVVRGLGYWFFYGNDKLGQWIVPSIHYMRYGIPLSFALPIFGLLAGALTRFRHRLFFLTLIVVGAVMAVGGHPYDDPSLAGSVLVEWTKTDLGLAFRSTARVLPLLVLGTSVLLGAGLVAVTRRLPRLANPLAVLAVVLVVANLPATWVGQMVDRNLRRDEDLPQYWEDAAEHLDAQPHDTRILELPGTDFAAYRWGNTVDPITPGLIDRPYAARELIPLGTPVSANLMNAIDRPLQEGTFDPDALAPLARMIAAGDVVLRSDLEYERFRTPRPETTWALLRSVPGLGDPIPFGEPVENQARPQLPLLDEIELATDQALEDPPPVAVFPVDDAASIVRALPAEHPIIVAGDGDGLVAATAAGVIDPDRAILYSAGLLDEESPEMLDAALANGADVVITDSNRRRARRWGAIRENEGYTEMAGEEALEYDVGDARLDIFPEATDDSFTVAVQRGGATVQASAYGNPVSYTPGDRAFFALDGDHRTAWKVGAFSEVEGEYLRITTDEPVTTDRIGLTQPLGDEINRWITEVELRFDGGDPVRVDLTEASRRRPGQVVEFPERTFSELEIEILRDTVGFRPKLAGVSAVGFSEVDLEGIQLEELIRPPVDLVEALGDGLDDHRLTYVLQRGRTNPGEPVRVDEEPGMRRLLDVPGDRAFELAGEARISAEAPDPLVDRLLGIPGAPAGGITARSSHHLAGDLSARASSAIDGDPTTAWQTPFDDLGGQFVEYELPDPITVDHLDLQLVADGRHSVPTVLRLKAGDEVRQLEVPSLEPSDDPDAATEVRIEFEPVESDTFRLTVLEAQRVHTNDWYSGGASTLPVAIAEVGLPGVERPEPASTVSDRCRSDLLTVDGEPVPVRLRGSTADAEARLPLALEGCDDAVAAAGETDLAAAQGRDVGIDVDTLVLSSGPGGEPVAPGVTGTTPEAPAVDVETPHELEYEATTDADEPFWLVVGESYGPEWETSVEGGTVTGHEIVSGYANGFYVVPDGDGPVTVSVTWPPQRPVWLAILISLGALVGCLALLVIDPRRRRREVADPAVEVSLLWPLRPRDRLVDLRPALLASLAALVLGIVLATPPVGVALAVAMFVSLRLAWGGTVVRLASVGVVLGASVYVFA
ncbi:MAG TPA: alpha-(1-_3)-arabinofuranosyltransferase family protein, partial [Acidimicrobiales bacterium]|nr:alpha-(1->3)-arabinofuranosyltransferase family protein [Acidimicrobiales bacterium]